MGTRLIHHRLDSLSNSVGDLGDTLAKKRQMDMAQEQIDAKAKADQAKAERLSALSTDSEAFFNDLRNNPDMPMSEISARMQPFAQASIEMQDPNILKSVRSPVEDLISQRNRNQDVALDETARQEDMDFKKDKELRRIAEDKAKAEDEKGATLEEKTKRASLRDESAQLFADLKENPDMSMEEIASRLEPFAQASTELGDPNVLKNVRTPLIDLLDHREDIEKLKIDAQEAAAKAKSDKVKNSRASVDFQKKLMESHAKHKTVANTAAAIDAYGKIKKSATGKHTGARDLALIFNYMKLLDPGSVVRESEFRSAAELRSYMSEVVSKLDRDSEGNLVTPNGVAIPSRLAQIYQKFDSNTQGAFLLPEQRESFLEASHDFYENALEQRIPVDDLYSGMATDGGLTANKVIAGGHARDQLKKFREERGKAETEGKPSEKETKVMINETQLYKFVEANMGSFEAAVAEEDAERTAAGKPPLSEEEKDRIGKNLISDSLLEAGYTVNPTDLDGIFDGE